MTKYTLDNYPGLVGRPDPFEYLSKRWNEFRASNSDYPVTIHMAKDLFDAYHDSIQTLTRYTDSSPIYHENRDLRSVI